MGLSFLFLNHTAYDLVGLLNLKIHVIPSVQRTFLLLCLWLSPPFCHLLTYALRIPISQLLTP